MNAINKIFCPRSLVILLCGAFFLSAAFPALAANGPAKRKWKGEAFRITNPFVEVGLTPLLPSALQQDDAFFGQDYSKPEIDEIRATAQNNLLFFIYVQNRSQVNRVYLYPAYNATLVDPAGAQSFTSFWESTDANAAYLRPLLDVLLQGKIAADENIYIDFFKNATLGYSYTLKKEKPLLARYFEGINGVLFPGALKDGFLIFPRVAAGTREIKLYLPDVRVQENSSNGIRIHDLVFNISGPGFRP